MTTHGVEIKIHQISRIMRILKSKIKFEYDVDDDGYELEHGRYLWELNDSYSKLRKTLHCLLIIKMKLKGGKK